MRAKEAIHTGYACQLTRRAADSDSSVKFSFQLGGQRRRPHWHGRRRRVLVLRTPPADMLSAAGPPPPGPRTDSLLETQACQ
jgi:hypothetical protein